MTLTEKTKRRIKKTAIIILSAFAAFLILSSAAIINYLYKYGFGLREYPKTLAVYLHLSKGFTVSENDGGSVFIGRHDYIYDDLLEEKGLYEEQGDSSFLYYYTNRNCDGKYKFCIYMENEWCHWFRVYTVSDGKIEDYLKG